MTCTKPGCTNRRFMDTQRCFDHQSMGTPLAFKLWFAFCATLALVMLGLCVWGGATLIQWVTSK